MKKIAIYLCVGAMVLGMTACGGNEETPESSSPIASVETTPIATEAPVTDGEGTTGEYIDISNGWSEEMNTIKEAVVNTLGENYWPNMPIPGEMLEGNYGITPDMYSDYMAEMPMISANVDTLLIIKANDDKVEAVAEALNAYRDRVVNDAMQYPQNIGKTQASRIETIGNYVCFVQLGGECMVDETTTEEESITKCQEQNELAIEVIRQTVGQ